MKKVLFQGDSITDAGRDREQSYGLGGGYPMFIRCRLDVDRTKEYVFQNRGVSGDRVVDVYARIKADIINLKPDILTILVGVNDVWHEFAIGNGVSPEKYRKIYHMLLEEIREALPDTRIILLEPFVLKGSATEAMYDEFRAGVLTRAQIVKELAEEFSLTFVPFQRALDELSVSTGTDFWLSDGVHPTGAFYQYMADQLIPVICAGE